MRLTYCKAKSICRMKILEINRNQIRNRNGRVLFGIFVMFIVWKYDLIFFCSDNNDRYNILTQTTNFDHEFACYKNSVTQTLIEDENNEKIKGRFRSRMELVTVNDESYKETFDLSLYKQKWYIFGTADLFSLQYA